MHMVFQTAAQEIAVIGVFVDLDNGGAAPVRAAARFRLRGAKRQEPTPAAAAPAQGSFGGLQGFQTTPMVTAPGVSSPVLETVFSKVAEIATPGTSVKTAPLAMSDIVKTILTGSFQR
jgi:hypothetical protein